MRSSQASPPSSPVTSAASSARATGSDLGQVGAPRAQEGLERRRPAASSRAAATCAAKPLRRSRWRAIASSRPARLREVEVDELARDARVARDRLDRHGAGAVVAHARARRRRGCARGCPRRSRWSPRRHLDTCQSGGVALTRVKAWRTRWRGRAPIHRSTPTARRCPSSCSPPRAARPTGRRSSTAATGPAVPAATLAARIEGVAAGLAALGFAPGDVLALQGAERARRGRAWRSARCARAARSPAIPPGATERGGRAPARDDAGERARLRARAGGRRRCAPAPAASVRERRRARRAPGALPLLELLAGDAPAPALALAPERVALLPCSSGTTGLPKPVMLTHGNLAAGVAQVQRGLALRPRTTRVLAVAPFAHVMGFVGGLAAPLAAGATVVTLPRFELPALLAAVERHRVTVLIVPPPVAAALAADPRVAGHDLVGARARRRRRRAAGARAPGAARRPAARRGDRPGLRDDRDDAGHPVPDRRHRHAAGLGRARSRRAPSCASSIPRPGATPAQAAGELWVRGPQVTPGYLGRPEATAALIDRDGWLRTGDLGFVDADGDVHVVDRLKELIKVDALQVAPAELEALLLAHPRRRRRRRRRPPRRAPRRGPGRGRRAARDARSPTRWSRGWPRASPRTSGSPRSCRADAIPRTPAGKVVRREVLAPRDQLGLGVLPGISPGESVPAFAVVAEAPPAFRRTHLPGGNRWQPEP